jgi:hypothetical protein
VLIGGMVIGSVLTGWPSRAMPQSTPPPTLEPPQVRRLPAADVLGEDLVRLPRFPDAVRTGHSAGLDDLHRLTEVSYLAAAELDDVRAFYRRVIADHGWQRADLDLAGGEWVYILVDGGTEAVIAMRGAGEMVEIELELSEPVVTPSPTSAPTPPPTPALVAPPPVEDGDDDEDGDD